MKFSPNDLCPCNLQKKYKKCCKLFHDGISFPKTALELMRSRYSAYALNKPRYIIDTTHKENQDFTTNFNLWEEDIIKFCESTQFLKLEILDFQDGLTQSFVTFKASLKQDTNDVGFTEKSKFLKVDSKWMYLEGEFLD